MGDSVGTCAVYSIHSYCEYSNIKSRERDIFNTGEFFYTHRNIHAVILYGSIYMLCKNIHSRENQFNRVIVLQIWMRHGNGS